MEAPNSLKPYMRECFASAKRLFLWSDVCAWTIGGLGVVTAVLPESWGGVVWGAGVAGFLLLITQQYLLYRFRRTFSEAEAVKRAFQLAEAHGRQVAEADLSKLRKIHGRLRPSPESYFNSPHPPGLKRLLMIVWESAFWSADLQREMAARYFRRAAGSSVVVGGVVLGLWYWADALGTGGPLAARVFLGIGSLLVMAEFWLRWRECEQTQRECEDVSMRCRALLDQKRVVEFDVWLIVLDYTASTNTAYPIPEQLHASRKPFLDVEWEKIAHEYTASPK